MNSPASSAPVCRPWNIAGPLVASIGAPTTLWYATLLVIAPTVVVLGVPEVRQLRSVATSREGGP